MENEFYLQTAIFDSIKSSSLTSNKPSYSIPPPPPPPPPAPSSSSNSLNFQGNQKSNNFGGRTNTLSREGIKPANVGVFAGSTFGKAGNRRHTITTQQKTQEIMPDLRRFSNKKLNTTSSHVKDNGFSNSTFLPRSQWISLGDGWFQTTPHGTGSCTRCGLHSIIESSLGQLYVCVYEPRTQIGVGSCLTEYPNYDLEISLKTIKAKNVQLNQTFEVIIGFKSATEYISLSLQTDERHWILSHTSGNNTTIISIIEAPDVRPNIFYSVLIQVRDTLLSVDVDGVPILTSLRISSGTSSSSTSTTGASLSGLMGLIAKGSKFAVKGWKLKARGNETNIKTPTPVKKTMSLRETLSNKGESNNNNNNNTNRLGPVFALGGEGLPTQTRRHSVSTLASSATPLTYSSITPSSNDNISFGGPGINNNNNTNNNNTESRLLRCASLLRDRHDRSAVDMVMSDIVQRDMGVTFDDIAALSTAKRLLNEAVVLPLMMPELFTGIREPWKGVLLFGPPGTGKTMLAKAVADMNHATFFSCSAASLISKYRGESEKIVKCLFEAARLCSPSIIFLDEVDSLVSTRGDGEHEASRRLKTEFFSQMDGIASSGQSGVMVLATTNCPWDLDEAIRRRLEKRIYIPLPDSSARIELFSIYLKTLSVDSDVTPTILSRYTEGYSGSDIHLVCREAAMMPMRQLLERYTPQDLNYMKLNGILQISPVKLNDFLQALHNTKPTVSIDSLERYILWDEEFGSR